eukprot:gene3067-287_t
MDTFYAVLLFPTGIKHVSVQLYPWMSTSLREFWGRRWNRTVHDMLYRNVFKRMKANGWSQSSAAQATFFWS